MTEIKPRFDDDGVGWCDDGCPQAFNHENWSISCIMQEMECYRPRLKNSVCPVWAKRMAEAATDLLNYVPDYNPHTAANDEQDLRKRLRDAIYGDSHD